jgi:fructan beta-fructosidase
MKQTIKKYLLPLFGYMLFLLYGGTALAQNNGTAPYSEPYRPQFHFSPKKGWIGDPCGLTYYKGKYQMYWWGKVVSDDLVYYKEISQKVLGGNKDSLSYFTGSTLIDKDNTAGFGANAYVAAYTLFNKQSKIQSQGISYSKDGESFQYFKGNPVLDIGSTEFRDPTVFWCPSSKQWVMVVAKALEKKIKFYGSKDLKSWNWLSDFGPAGAQEKAWECPDLFQLPVDGNSNDKRWVMVVSIDWAREQYFIGNFDGKTFTLAADSPKEALYVDQGLDFYASRTFQDYDGTLRATRSMGWIATWDYAQLVPSTWGKGFWSIARELELKSYPEGLRLVQQPIEALKQLRGKSQSFTYQIPQGTKLLSNFQPSENVYELEAGFNTGKQNVFGLNLCVGEGRKVGVSYDTETNLLTIDRTNCAKEKIEKFSRKTSAKVMPINGKLRMHFFVDKSSIELFTNDGKEVFTLLTYPGEQQTGIETFARNAGTELNLKAWNLKSVWN